jgi:putative membrane protein
VIESALLLVVTAAWYLYGLLRLRRRQTRGWGVQGWEMTAFAGGWLTLVIALLSPIATISDVLFSMHMTQHELLMLIAAPLFTLARPIVPMMFALPERWRVGGHGLFAWSAAWQRLTSAVAVFVIHGVVLWVWHLPLLYEAAILDDRVHLLQHVMFVSTASLFWWGLLRGRYGRAGYGTAVFYVFATVIHSGGLGALMTVSTAPWYPLYAHRAHAGVDPLTDQQLAGLIMWIPAGVVLTIFGLAIFAAWLGEAERRRRVVGGASGR